MYEVGQLYLVYKFIKDAYIWINEDIKDKYCGKNTTYHTFTDGMVENLSNQNIWFCGNEFPLFQCHAFS